jgi:hypothetical protein
MRLFNLKSVATLLCCILAFFVFTSLPVCHAQAASGMTGTVTDQSGAAIPGATVVLTDASNGTKYTQVTDSIGGYRFAQIPPGSNYIVRITAKGFASVTVSNVSLLVGQVRTQNVSLSVGTQVSTVEVTASNAVVTLDTSDAIVGNDLDPQQLNNLPVQQRADPTALFTMQPGVTVSGAVTGARVDQNYVTVDGLDVNDFATGGANQSNSGAGVSSGFAGHIVGNAPIDSVDQLHVGVAGNEADIGAASGGQFQLVTKSGTNRFHGSLNEYHRDPSLVANSWFSNNSNPIVPRNHLIQNQFGGNIGGPVMKNKLFFFFDFNDSKIISGLLVQRTVPLDSLRNGVINYCTNPTCTTTNNLTPAQVQGFDPAGIGESSTFQKLFTSRFPHTNNTNSGDGLNSGGFGFNAPNNDYTTSYVGRGDYHITPNMNLWGVMHINRENAVNAPNEFPGDPQTAPYLDKSYSFVLGHTWAIGSTKTNQVFLGETVQKVGFPDQYNPQGSTAFTFSDGADQSIASNLYLWPNSQARRVPIPVIGDDFSWIKGRHTVQFGGTFKDILAHNTNISDFNLSEIGLGGQVFSLCGPTAGDCGKTNGVNNPSLRPSDIDPSNSLLYDEAFAFTLARIGNVQSTYNYDAQGNVLKQLTGDQRFYRYYQTQLYFQDSWKVVPSFTFNYGMTYQYFSVPYETRGLESIEPLSFNDYFLARVQQSTLGESGSGAVPLLSYVLGGKGNGSSAPPLYQPEYRDLAPHFGFAWNPGFDKKLVINGGASIVYDRTVIFAVQSIQDADSYLFQQSKVTQNGSSTATYNSIKNDPRLDANNGLSNVSFSPPATPRPPYQPFSGSYCAGYAYSPCGLQNGYAFNATIDPALKTPYSFLFNFGVQRDTPWNMVVKANFVSRLGRRLLAQPDAEQILDFNDTQSGQLLSQAFSSIVTQVRQGVAAANITVQPWFENLIQLTPGDCDTCTGYASNTELVTSGGIRGLVRNGDFGDFMQAISGILPANVGDAAQFSENTFYTNSGFSSYNGLLLTLTKNPSHGISYDFNYTLSHSIDNVSFFANSAGDTGIGGIGLICDVIRPRECRARSDYDMRHLITADATYQMPFGKGRMFAANVPLWTNEIIGDWNLSGIGSFHTGLPWSANSNAFVASYSNDAPPIFIGSDRSLIANHVSKLPTGGVRDFADSSKAAASFEGPIGFQIGPRNSFQGPDYFNADLGLAKTFPIYKEAVNLKFRADAFNALNHPNFDLPAENVYNGLDQQDYQRGSKFGQITYTVSPPGNLNNGARVLQLSLRLEF